MDKNADNMILSSSDGWNEIEFQLNNFSDEISVAILAKGKFWERAQGFDIESATLVEDFDIKFLQAIILKDNLVLLKEQLESWFVDPKEIDIEMSSSYPRISIFIGESDEFICSTSKPAFILSYRDSRIETKVKFVTDQSCLKLMLQDIRRWLRY